MLKNYIMVTIRNLLKYKVYSFINFFGFSIALVPVLLAFLFIRYEYSYDTFNKKYDRIYRVAADYKSVFERERKQGCVMPGPFAAAMKQELPEVEYASRVLQDVTKVSYNGNELGDENVLFTDPDFLKIFTIDLVMGIPARNNTEPDYAFCSESVACKYFGNENPIGKKITVKERYELTIRGVYKDIPENSHLAAGFIIPADLLSGSIMLGNATGWGLSMYPVYYLLKENAKSESVDKKIPGLFEKYAHRDKGSMNYFSQPLSDIHLNSTFVSYRSNKREIINGKYTVYFYVTAAFIMLLIACINYVNLSTALFSQRIKEMSIRKIVGAERGQLIRQLLLETFVLTFSSLIITLLITILILPYFRAYVERNIQFNIGLFSEIALLTFFISFCAGIYPALSISSIRPLSFFRGKNIALKNPFFRNTLVVVQFILTLFFVFSTIVVKKQLDFATDSELGFRAKDIVTIFVAKIRDKISPAFLKEEISKYPGVAAISLSSSPPNSIKIFGDVDFQGKPPNTYWGVAQYTVDENFLDLYEMKVLSGRKFSNEFPSELNEGILINETAARETGWKNPIGKTMTFNDSFFGNVTKRVIGVVKDSHNRSFKAQILPSVYIYDAGDKTISIKVKPGYMKETVKYLTNRLGQYYTKSQLEIKYLDDEIKASYKREYKVLDIFALFSLCAIIISCLGLYGVISFTTEIRSKEIGIRKVLGASVFQVVNVLFKEMAGLMLIAGIVAAPLGYYLMDKWLADFAYHININAAMFIGAVFVVYLIAVCSMVSQVIKASLKNPVETLKYE